MATRSEKNLTKQITDLEAKLAAAIREELFERAAKLRDQIRELQGLPKYKASPPESPRGGTPPPKRGP